MTEDNPIIETVRLFFEVGKIFKNSVHKVMENRDLTLPQSIVIGTIFKHGEIKISELSKKVNLSNSTVSGILDRLEKQDIVERVRSEEDRRSVYIKLTDKYKAAKKDIFKQAEENFGELLSGVTPEQLKIINEGLNVLKEALVNGVNKQS